MPGFDLSNRREIIAHYDEREFLTDLVKAQAINAGLPFELAVSIAINSARFANL